MPAQDPRSLTSVIEVVPPEAYENPTWKGLLYVGRDLAVYTAALLALFLADSWWLVIPLWLLAGLAVVALFILAHDAAHGALFKSSRLNYVLGQLMMLPSLHVYEAWVLGHNRLHHGHTVRGGGDFVWHPLTREQYDELSLLRKLRHRIEWSWLGGGLYYLREVWWDKMIRLTPPRKWESAINRDWWIVVVFFAAATLGLGAAGTLHYGTLGGGLWVWFKLLIVPWILFNYAIGITVHIHHIGQDIPWHTRHEWNKFKGQVEGTTIHHVPRWLDFFLHNIFLHVPHHVDMRIPFYGLPAAAEAIKTRFGDVVREHPLKLSDYLRNVRRCKLYDFDRRVWSSYRAA
jgi:omega-6 fatty acid desaturase (delta-12 desaturase)